MTEANAKSPLANSAILLVGAALIGFSIYTAATIPLQPTIHRGLFLLGVIYLALLIYPLRGLWRLLDITIAAAATASLGYLVINWEALAYRSAFEPEWHEYVLGALALGSVIEATRRAAGLSLAILGTLALLYALFGNYVPEPFTHRGFSFARVVTSQYLTHEGLFGAEVGVATTLVAAFLVFGALIQQTGVADLFMRLASRFTLGAFGGPGKVEVVSSALMGTVSGSSTANVVSTGTTTIPLMKKAGFSPTFAAAVEAASSTGGQIMPPVMGVAAFVMAEVTGIPYATIALAAVIPAILYYVCVYVAVDLEARRLGLLNTWTGLRVSSARELLAEAYLLMPLVVLVYLMFVMYSATKAAFWASVVALLVGLPRWRSMIQVQRVRALITGFAQAAVIIVLSCATAGIVVGALNLTGMSLNLSYIFVELAGQNAFLLLVFVMVLCIILGTGLPTPAAYAVAAAFAAPMLTTIGLSRLNAHLFVLFFASLSSITPPVATAAFAAAGIAGAPPMRTSFVATKLGLAAFVVPYMFAENSALLLGQAPLLDSAIAAVSALFGACALGVAVIGHYKGPIGPVERAGYLAAGLLLIHPSLLYSACGLILGLGLLVYHRTMYRKLANNAPAV
jgi:TRAP transporter 4TM/12TM fusion protein